MSKKESSAVIEREEEVSYPNKEVVVARKMPEMVRIRFYNLRDPGRELKFFLSTETHPLHHYTLMHDKEYDLPLEVVHHLEGMNEHMPNSCMIPLRKDRLAQNGITSESFISGWKPNFQCKFIKTL
jgi:hypothetical protein